MDSQSRLAGPDGVTRAADTPFARMPQPVAPARRRIEAGRSRQVVASVVATMVAIGSFVALVGSWSVDRTVPRAPEPVAFGLWTIWVSWERPTAQVVGLAVLGIVAIAAVAVALEAGATLLTLRPTLLEIERRRPPLPSGTRRVRVTVLIPARNEESRLGHTLAALRSQTRPPDRVIVVVNNCTDRTAAVAAQMQAEVIHTHGTVRRKAGALNQALQHLLPTLIRNDVVLVMDADTLPERRFIEVGAGHLERDPLLSAVGGIFYGEDGYGLVGQLQRNEYTRYALQLRARNGRVFVLTGTASMFRAETLLDIAAARGTYLPGDPGCVYDADALTEDNELTLALRSLGATMISPSQCRVTTELMPTWRDLRRQRMRWQRGALENIATYGITRATARYWGQQLGLGYAVIALSLFWLLTALMVLAVDTWIWFPFWLAMGAVFVTERVITVWSGGRRARALAVPLIPELLYDLFLQSVFVTSLVNITLGRYQSWGQLQKPPGP